MSRPTPFVISPPADFCQPLLLDQAQRLAQAYEQHQRVEETQLQAVGMALWEALGLGNALDTAKQAAGQHVLPIILHSDDAAILSLPWETLYHPRFGFLARAAGFSFSRRHADTHAQLPAAECQPLRVLLFASLPDDLSERERLDVEAEQAAVQEVLMAFEQAGKVQLDMPNDGRFDTFKTHLNDFQPHLMYLSGHGNFRYDAHEHRAWGEFLFEDPQGNKAVISDTQLAACFQNTGVQLLVLSACLSAKQHPDYLHHGLSQALYQAGVPHVIGMRESVNDHAAIQFARSLLGSLAKQQSVDVALQTARATMNQPLPSDEVTRDMGDPMRSSVALAQWCLPQLLSHDLAQTLVDWQFQPQPRTAQNMHTMLGDVSVTLRFIGRRRELRQWQSKLHGKQANCLLLTGAGGMGKTALAGELIRSLGKDDYQVFTFSLRPEHDWRGLELDMELALAADGALFDEYQRIQSKNPPTVKRLTKLLQLLLKFYQNKLVLFFDNLESIQEPQFPHGLTDPDLQPWLDAARSLTRQGLKILLTSRWRLPNWADHEHLILGRPVYGDYVALARTKNLPITGERLQHAYQVLGGNFRALTYFAAAAKKMNVAQEKQFLAALSQAETEAQTDMALQQVLAQRSPDELALLQRLSAYQPPVPLDGVKAVWLYQCSSSQAVETLLPRLLAVSLVEASYHPRSQQTEFQLPALVRSGLACPPPDQPLLQVAAEFLLWLLEENLNRSWEHRLATYQALQAAQLTEAAQRLVLDWIVVPLNRAGMYRDVLKDWLLPIANAQDRPIRGEALGQIGKQYLHLGDYATALDYLQQSLAIQREIGDKAGEGATLNNLSQIYDARGDYATALDYLQQSLVIQREIVGDKAGEGATLNNLSQIYKARGDYATALDYLQQSLVITREIGDKAGEGTTLNNLATTAHATGDYATALDYLQQSLAICREIGDKSGEGATLNNLSQIYKARGDYATALDYLQQSLVITREIGNKAGEGVTLGNLGNNALAIGDYVTALDYLQQSLVIKREIGDKQGESVTLNNLSRIAQAKGDYVTALRYSEQDLQICREIGDKAGEGATLNNLATTAHATGDYATALDYLQQSLAIQREIGDVAGLCATTINIGHIHWQNDEQREALQSWVAAYQIAQKIGEAQALNALEKLAGQLGLPNGLAGWEVLAQRMNAA
jgi:tetratricopeptide (TPR) repeat protein